MSRIHRLRHAIVVGAGVVAAASLAAGTALAEEPTNASPHVANWWHVGPEYAETPALGLLTITFVIFVAGLVWFVRPKLASYMENRADSVRKAIEEAKREKLAAEARAKDAEDKLKNLAKETERLRADFELQGKAELERFEKLAHETAQRIAKDAEDTIAAETERARQSLRAEVAKLALEMAEERIRAALSTGDDTRLQKTLIDDLAA